MTTRIVQSLLAIGRLRAANNVALSRKAFSSQISQSYAAPAAGPATSFVQFWYHLFGSSTARYATFLAVGVIAAEMGTNSLTDYLWESNNAGKTYKQVEWSKFDPQDDEEEDEDDDDDDDDDEEEDDDE